ncbi:MAG TPA: G1 family glutamic endopeptidase [Candidatus Saccharimonadia bacterium]|nr:G1 family glutamic endopeptidase [Candidatus Saccharimonadia bacterium]
MRKFQYHWRRLGAAIVAVATILAIAGLGAPAADATSQSYSGHWAGLVDGGGGYTKITADVVVPSVTTACGTGSAVAVYVGLGGWGSLPFAQNGFTVTPQGVGVWWEVFDRNGNGPVAGIALATRPGNKLRFGFEFASHGTVLTFYWANLTTGKVVTRRITNAARYYNAKTADYVVERPNYPKAGAPLAQYRPITFTRAQAVRSGRWVPAYNTGSVLVSTLGRAGNVISHVTAARADTFTTAWSGCS